MAKLFRADEIKGGITVMLEEKRADGQLMLRPEAINSVDEEGFCDMWNTVLKMDGYGQTWRCWGGVPSIEEQVGAAWAK